MHPAGVFVEALVDEELAPGDSTVGVEPLVAEHLEFRTEEEGGVGIDEKERVVAGGVRRRDGHAVRAGWFRWVAVVYVGGLDCRFSGVACLDDRRLAVEGLELGEVDALDVAADAA